MDLDEMHQEDLKKESDEEYYNHESEDEVTTPSTKLFNSSKSNIKSVSNDKSKTFKNIRKISLKQAKELTKTSKKMSEDSQHSLDKEVQISTSISTVSKGSETLASDFGEPPRKKRLLSDDNSSTHENEENATGYNEDASEQSEDEDLQSVLHDHFAYNISEKDGSGKLKYDSRKIEWPEIGKFVYMKPVLENESAKEPSVKKKEITDFDLKKNLLDCISASSHQRKMSKLQIGFLNLISDYFDVVYMKRTHENAENLRFVYTLHVLNHILKSRAKVIHHNSKLSKNPDEEYRDQGFTRTLSVILVPFRHDCYRIVSSLIAVLSDCVIMNKKRFQNEYGPQPTPQHFKNKPEDYDKIFEGNTNEDFKIGLKIKNKSITLYSEFYSSDLIIASPLGLRQIIGAEGDKDRDFDFLSSIEVLVIDRADVLMLQNPVNLLHVLKHFNLIPKESHGCDFFRVRLYASEGKSKFYRQTVLLSSVEHMWFEALIFQNLCFNYSGYLISRSDVKSPAIQHILVPGLKMCFRWFDTDTLETEIDDRFNFFVSKVLPDYKDKAFSQTMVYVPSYFDFVRLRNHFRENELSSVMVCEYSKKGKVAQARDVFFKGHRHFMLYTERAHFYSRYHIKGIQHIIFYQVPTYPGFFRELCNLMLDSNPRRKYEEKSCCVLASKHDLLQLKHVVGLNETKHMFNAKKKVFVKYTD